VILIILTKRVKIKWHPRNRHWYEDKGYLFTKYKDEFEVDIKDLSDWSTAKINIQCDGCGEILFNIPWQNYKTHNKDGKYYCRKCSYQLYGIENYRKSRLKNGKSFEQWCLENNRQDILDRWDYDLNDCNPSDISHSSNSQRYFKCPRRLHNSELKSINSFTNNRNGININFNMQCSQCNSFAQFGIDNLCDDFLEKYWDYEKNNELEIDPWKIMKCSDILKVWIKCQEDLSHKSYRVTPSNFYIGSRCPICKLSKGEIKIKQWLDINNIIYKIYKEFEGLIGLNTGNLSYDFYLPNYNLLIEYQGIQHEKPIDFEGKGEEWAKEQFEYQQEHDRRKREYAKNNNINLLEIWYYDFDNIEEILTNQLLKEK